MTDLLYALRAPTEELRYSLRSVCANLPHEKIWTVGPSRPKWLTSQVGHIPTRESPGRKWVNLPAAIEAACQEHDLAEDLLYMNDDFFCLEPVTDVLPMHRGPLMAGKTGSTYNAGFADTEAVLRRLGVEGDLFNFEVHLPLPFDRDKMLRVLKLAKPWRGCLHYRSLYANYHRLDAERISDVKVYGNNAAPLGAWASSSTASWGSRFGKDIRRKFGEPSIYER